MRDFPAPGYAAWAVVARIESDGFAVMRDLSRAVLLERAPTPAAAPPTPPSSGANGFASNATFQNPTGHFSLPQPVQPAAPSSATAGGGSEAELGPPEGYWQENSCLPLRCNLSTGAWGLPVVSAEEVLFGLPADDYASLDYERERPPICESFANAGASASKGWREEPQVQILTAARKEIACWSSPGADLSEALSALWPQLELGFSMIPGRPCDRLPSWRASFLAIKPPKQDYDSDSGGSRAGSRASNEPGSPFFAADSYVVGLV